MNVRMMSVVVAALAVSIAARAQEGLATEREVLDALTKVPGAAKPYEDIPRDEELYRDAALMERLREEAKVVDMTISALDHRGAAADVARERRVRTLLSERMDTLRKKPRKHAISLDDSARIVAAIAVRDMVGDVEKAMTDYKAGRLSFDELRMMAIGVAMFSAWGGESGGHAGDQARHGVFAKYGADDSVRALMESAYEAQP